VSVLAVDAASLNDESERVRREVLEEAHARSRLTGRILPSIAVEIVEPILQMGVGLLSEGGFVFFALFGKGDDFVEMGLILDDQHGVSVFAFADATDADVIGRDKRGAGTLASA
jgi:hypothetical protein